MIGKILKLLLRIIIRKFQTGLEEDHSSLEKVNTSQLYPRKPFISSDPKLAVSFNLIMALYLSMHFI